MEKFTDITEQIKRQKTMEPPPSLTDHVMERIPRKYPGIFPAASFVHHLYAQAFAPEGSNPNGPTKGECSFYFLITGIFYLIMGIVLITGFRGVDTGTAMMKWLKLQPYFTTGAAMWFLAIGAMLMIDGRIGLKIAKYGTLLYIFGTLMNSIMLWPFLRIPYAGIFIIGLAATSAVMGILLAGAVEKMESRTV